MRHCSRGEKCDAAIKQASPRSLLVYSGATACLLLVSQHLLSFPSIDPVLRHMVTRRICLSPSSLK